MSKPLVVLALLVVGSLLPALAVAADPPATPLAVTPVTTASAATPQQRLDLETASIRGNQELPKVLYIVPWKEPALVEPAGRPLNSLVDEALAPVDREVFRRQMTYFDQLYASPGVAVGGAAPAAVAE